MTGGLVGPVSDGATGVPGAGPGSARPVLRLDPVNPRHRRLVIPVALAVLLIIVVVAAVLP